ncbi:Hypothetical_protein [Hexamita inflata]|uniref:Hypothetical_protein n=1 Tax=Hexamita inflata TaxID=28002 RepID=A0AA86R3K5_9EUKA|nr:Hypothetical protein HINF_LOCUS54056 [Hexamita inflata]
MEQKVSFVFQVLKVKLTNVELLVFVSGKHSSVRWIQQKSVNNENKIYYNCNVYRNYYIIYPYSTKSGYQQNDHQKNFISSFISQWRVCEEVCVKTSREIFGQRGMLLVSQ